MSIKQIVYNLSNIPSFHNAVTNKEIDENVQKYYNVKKYTTKSKEEYHIIHYAKEMLSPDLYSTYGLLRSVIISGSKLVSFAPPKSMSPERFMAKYPKPKDNTNGNIVAEEFIEGTMINVFFDPNYGVNGCWQIATRNTIGADVTFYKWSKKTFNSMFIDACIENKLNIQTLNPLYTYSFVLQHPENRIVVPIKKPKLYLVAVYEIRQNADLQLYDVFEEDLSIVKSCRCWEFTTIQFPEIYEFNSYTELINKFASPNTSYNIMGTIVKNLETGERMKFRNPIYEEVRFLRGNQPKLMYQYLTLRQQGKIPDYLKFYPESKKDFSIFREQLHMFTDTLHKNYVSCYIKKENPLKEFSDQYRTHMFKLHELYINELRQTKLCVSNTVVINYVNKLHPSLLMYCLNYNMRKRYIDGLKPDEK
uniref:T4 RNA ligase 1-like N-terminal domain-containing protein n=1 Tax=viral metagenome TaxID=1070528 RepID=A0A6C0IRD0_9ZZZZ